MPALEPLAEAGRLHQNQRAVVAFAHDVAADIAAIRAPLEAGGQFASFHSKSPPSLRAVAPFPTGSVAAASQDPVPQPLLMDGGSVGACQSAHVRTGAALATRVGVRAITDTD